MEEDGFTRCRHHPEMESVLERFQESPMSFPPLRRNDHFSWSDRILHSSLPNAKLEQKSFNRIPLRQGFFRPWYLSFGKSPQAFPSRCCQRDV